MNFLLISNNDFDGVGQPSANLCKTLIDKGHKTKLIVLHKLSKKSYVTKIKRSLLARTYLFFLNLIKKKYSEIFSFGYSSVNYQDLEKFVRKADVIIILELYKVMSNRAIEKILQTKKVVYFRPLDIELASGGCHFNERCTKYKTSCKPCPKLYLNNFFNTPFKNQLEKKRIFEKYKPTVFTQNNYVKKLFKESIVLKNANLVPIFLGINKKRNKDFSKSYAREKLGIDKKEKIILFGSFDLNSKIKGGHLLLRSLKILEQKFSDKFSNVRLVTIGNKNNFEFKSNKIKWSHLGLIQSDVKLNLIYRSCDVLVCPSLYCFGPHIVTEALLNDLPVVAFDLGVAQDTVFQGKNGFLIKNFNLEKYAEAIFKTLFKIKNQKNNGLINRMKKICSSDHEANQIIKIAQEDLIKSRRSV
jgi:glycosyltransferase involved in cell wall biosynthesis